MYPQSNSARSVRDLSGVWDFRFNTDEPWQPIAVPASYNDQSPDPEFRRHYGMAYYRTTFTVPEGARRVLRFDAVTHNAVVRLNGQEIASHRGGFLPFEADITALAQPGETVTLDVEVDNRIGHSPARAGADGKCPGSGRKGRHGGICHRAAPRGAGGSRARPNPRGGACHRRDAVPGCLRPV